MMKTLEVFFDYACPYCLRGHEALMELLPECPDISVLWRPCEAHPRPDPYGPHSDLCIQGMFFAQEHGADLTAYHRLMYRAALLEHADIENIGVLTRYVAGLLDTGAFRAALESGRYLEALQKEQEHAFLHSGVWAVPAYRLEGRRLDAVEDVGVGKAALAAFLKG